MTAAMLCLLHHGEDEGLTRDVAEFDHVFRLRGGNEIDVKAVLEDVIRTHTQNQNAVGKPKMRAHSSGCKTM